MSELTCEDVGCNCASKKKKEAVDHPQHYKRGGIEAIDIIEAFDLGFCLGNALKYICRAGNKDLEVEDIEKAIWYLRRWVEKRKAATVNPHVIPGPAVGTVDAWVPGSHEFIGQGPAKNIPDGRDHG